MSRLDEFFDCGRGIRVAKKRRKRTNRHDLESAVLKECMAWLNRCGYYAERRNTGAIKTDTAFFRFGSPGAADLFVVIDGRHVEVEVKRRDGKGTLSPSQKAFQQLMADYRIPHVVVRSVEELEKFIGTIRLAWTR